MQIWYIFTDECGNRFQTNAVNLRISGRMWLSCKLKVPLMQISLAQIELTQQITVSLTDLDNSAMIIFSYK